jgi:hypothetical protein
MRSFGFGICEQVRKTTGLGLAALGYRPVGLVCSGGALHICCFVVARDTLGCLLDLAFYGNLSVPVSGLIPNSRTHGDYFFRNVHIRNTPA